jgi:hypothetical protein
MFVKTSAIRIALKGHLKDKKLLLLAVTENPLGKGFYSSLRHF